MSTSKLLDREAIATTALRVADAEGFSAVSMRRVAQELGVGTMSLYYYVKNKAELIAVMDDALMAELYVPKLFDDPRAAVHMIAARTRDLYLRHPWALTTLLASSPGINAMRHAEQCLQSLSKTRMTTKEKLTLLALIDDFVFGYALRESGRDPHGDHQEARRLLESGNFPQLAHAYTKEQENAASNRFEIGLDALLNTYMPAISRQTSRSRPPRKRAIKG
jgi:AcrR family transcriptional regulator